jgi:hypothetical protein
MMYVIAPWSEFEPQQYRFADCAAYFKVKRALLTAMVESAADDFSCWRKNRKCDYVANSALFRKRPSAPDRWSPEAAASGSEWP